MGGGLRPQVLLLLMALLLSGCGAKTKVPYQLPAGALPLKQTEAIALLLGRYDHFEFAEHGSRFTAEKRADLETRLGNCLEKAATDHEPPIRTIPTHVVKNYLKQIYGFDDFPNAYSRLIPALKNPPTEGGIERTGLRYLVIADFHTDETSSIEPVLKAEGGNGGGICLLGMTDTGNRQSNAELQVIDIPNRSNPGSIGIDSSGKQGWAAGVCICIIIPIPYYLPWWSMTETEVCDALGSSVVTSIAPGN